MQTVTLPLADIATMGSTIADVVQSQVTANGHQARFDWGQELPALISVTLQLMMYVASSDPDLVTLEPGSFARPAQLERSTVVNVGWRVGAALRSHGAAASRAGEGEASGVSGWRLPPHIRRAHWHRVRVARRDGETGAVVGSRTGVQGQDWEYQMRWYPPTPVNADTGVDVVVRDLAL